ncbi:uncharacterized protein LOC133300833 [Gastrolobium bilobum]|uniref:uncharacterized protein LOC133300833 n=1 Tax=Gastrolobium bilobum TaxID=150636 RepID=UPI002AB1FB3C|nr:uncharacterized protein LOC133300833 [Gastrolobium bilobum]
MSESAYNGWMQLMRQVVPKDNNLAKDFYQAKKKVQSRRASPSLPPFQIGSSPSTTDSVMGSAGIPHTPSNPMGPTQQAASSGRGRRASPSLPPLQIGSSPSTTDSVMGSAGIPHTPSDPMGPTQQAASPASEVGDAASTLQPEWGSCDPQTRRIWVRPLRTTEFEPYNEIMKFIKDQIFRNFTQVWSTWKDIPEDTQRAWLNEFLEHYRWLPEDRYNLVRAWHHKATTMFSHKMNRVRYDIGKNAWCSENLKIQLKEKWKNCLKFQKRSAQNKENRSKQETPTYAGGSIPISKHRQNIEASGEVPPEKVDWFTFERTHSQQLEAGQRRWLSPRAEQIAENYQKLEDERSAQAATDGQSSSSYSDNGNMLVIAAGGFNKKGRVVGLGGYASRLKPSKRPSTQVDSLSADGLKRMKVSHFQIREQLDAATEQLTQQTEQLTQQADFMKQQAEIMKQMQEQLRLLMQDKEANCNKTKGPAPDDDPDDDDDFARTLEAY